MDMWQEAVPCPVVESTAGAGGQHEPVSGGAKPGASALWGTLGLSPHDIPWGGLHRGLMLGRQVTFPMA